MALLFAEHCDNWSSSSHITARGWVENTTMGTAYTTNEGVTGAGSFYRSLYNDSYTRAYYRDITGASASTIHSAFWFKCTNEEPDTYLHFLSRVTVGGNYCGIKSKASGVATMDLFVPIGANGTNVGTCTTNVCDGGWHYLEFEIALHTSAGTAKMWVDSALEVNFSGATASASAPLAVTRWLVGSHTKYSYMDDLILWTDVDTGDGWTTNLGGGVRIFKTVRPTSDAAVQFTRSTGGTSYTLVDEQGVSSTDYVESGTDGHIDRYGFADHGLSGV